MSAKNTLANKAIRRQQRAENAEIQAKKQALQARMIDVMMNPPEEPRVSDLVIAESVLWTPEQEQ